MIVRSALKFSTFFLLSLSLFLSCHSKDGNVSSEQKEKSTPKIVVATLPIVEAIPLYYAREKGIDDSLGLHLVLKSASSQFDVEEVLNHGTAEVGMLDLARLAYIHSRGKRWKSFAEIEGEVGIAASKGVRIKKMVQMDERTLAVERYCMQDLVREQVQQEAKLPYDRILVAQINSYYLRTIMLDESQVDGAVLPQPFLQMAILHGHKQLNSKPLQWHLAFVANDSVLEKKASQLKLLTAVYKEAVKQLNARADNQILTRIAERLTFYPEVIPWLEKVRYKELQRPISYDKVDVSSYLVRRKVHGNVSKPYSTNVLP